MKNDSNEDNLVDIAGLNDSGDSDLTTSGGFSALEVYKFMQSCDSELPTFRAHFLLYYCQGAHWKLYNEELFLDKILWMESGPLICGILPESPLVKYTSKFDQSTEALICQVVKSLKKFREYELQEAVRIELSCASEDDFFLGSSYSPLYMKTFLSMNASLPVKNLNLDLDAFVCQKYDNQSANIFDDDDDDTALGRFLADDRWSKDSTNNSHHTHNPLHSHDNHVRNSPANTSGIDVGGSLVKHLEAVILDDSSSNTDLVTFTGGFNVSPIKSDRKDDVDFEECTVYFGSTPIKLKSGKYRVKQNRTEVKRRNLGLLAKSETEIQESGDQSSDQISDNHAQPSERLDAVSIVSYIRHLDPAVDTLIKANILLYLVAGVHLAVYSGDMISETFYKHRLCPRVLEIGNMFLGPDDDSWQKICAPSSVLRGGDPRGVKALLIDMVVKRFSPLNTAELQKLVCGAGPWRDAKVNELTGYGSAISSDGMYDHFASYMAGFVSQVNRAVCYQDFKMEREMDV
jgi:hypothetical protein